VICLGGAYSKREDRVLNLQGEKKSPSFLGGRGRKRGGPKAAFLIKKARWVMAKKEGKTVGEESNKSGTSHESRLDESSRATTNYSRKKNSGERGKKKGEERIWIGVKEHGHEWKGMTTICHGQEAGIPKCGQRKAQDMKSFQLEGGKKRKLNAGAASDRGPNPGSKSPTENKGREK